MRHTRHLVLLTYLVNLFANANNGVPKQLQIVLDFAEPMTSGSQCIIGTVYDHQARRWTTTTALKQQTRLTAALHYVMANILFLTDVMAVRFAKGVRRLTSLQEATMSFLYVWTPGNFADVKVMDTTGERVDLPHLMGKGWQTMVTMHVYTHGAEGRSLGSVLNEASTESLQPTRPLEDSSAAENPQQLEPIAEEGEHLEEEEDEDLSETIAEELSTRLLHDRPKW